MPTKLKVLIAEDSAADVELAIHELHRADYDPEWTGVETESDYLAQLDRNWDIVLADFNMPEFSGPRALELLRERAPDLPFIIVSGTIGEEMAASIIKSGADDYVSKDRLGRLGTAVGRALRDADERRKRKLAEERLKNQHRMLARTEGIAHIGSWEWEDATDTVTWSDEMFRIFQRDPREGAPSFAEQPAFYHPDDMARLGRAVEAAVADGTPYDLELRAIRKDGEARICLARGTPEWAPGGRASRLFGSLQDISESKKAEVRLQETLAGLRKALAGTILVLSAVSEKRDPYTAGHQRRVADLAVTIARDLGLPQDRIEGIRVAGVLHDIGKLSVPAELLSKPGRLSKIEYALIQDHAQVGHDILKGIDFAWPVATMILQHHERLDGSGYPQGLKDGDILLEARILAVSDVIEAMASHRPYRASLGVEAALNEIESHQGVLYDPDVVAACLRIFREKGYTLKD